MYYIVVDDDEIIVLTDIINGNQIHCSTLEYSIDSMNYGFVLADNKIIFEAGEVGDTSELDTLFTDAFSIQIITSEE
jgi:hypothetical protein